MALDWFKIEKNKNLVWGAIFLINYISKTISVLRNNKKRNAYIRSNKKRASRINYYNSTNADPIKKYRYEMSKIDKAKAVQ